MLLPRRSPAWGYLIAVLGTGIVEILRISTDGPVRTFVATLAFILAVLVAGMVGGWKAGLLTTFLCLLIERYFFIDPLHSFAIPGGHDTVRILAYTFVGIAISLLCEGLLRAWRRIEERQRHLEREMSERLAVAQERLQLVEQLRQDDRRKDEFLATLAHELRNPLAPLSNALELWEFAKNKPEQLDELRAMMRRQVRQMTRLIDDLLDVSRISRGKISLRAERVDLQALLASAIESVKPVIDANRQRLEVSLPSEPVFVRCDATRISQVIGNVVHNAAKYTPELGEIRVTVAREGKSVRISVRDTGCGIPPELLGSIFEMFQQVDQTLDRAQGGLGIGLTLAKRLIEMHGGSIEAHSDGKGQGSEFVISLSVDTFEGAAVVAEQSPVIAAPRELRRRHILVVDDLRESAQTLARMLRALGQEVTTAHDGQSTLTHVREHKPEVVFLDIAMPGMNGYEVARHIRASNGAEPPLLVALTGYGQDDDRRRAREAGFDSHLTKPTSIEQLTSILSGAGSAAVAANP